ncbi:Hypothetical predicted protein, partial [Olea europaea subsp. europaea]
IPATAPSPFPSLHHTTTTTKILKLSVTVTTPHHYQNIPKIANATATLIHY